jgi:hypothetical protein
MSVSKWNIPFDKFKKINEMLSGSGYEVNNDYNFVSPSGKITSVFLGWIKDRYIAYGDDNGVINKLWTGANPRTFTKSFWFSK